jgi:hypothetical protein
MSDWISVEDRLPPPDVNMVQYLGWVECPYYKGTQKIVTWHTDRFIGYPAGATNVTYWMLLPSPP